MTIRRRSLMRLTLLLSLVGAMLVVAAPASASNITPTGTPIFFNGRTTFAANTPFYIQHGFTCNLGPPTGNSCQYFGTGNFSLYVDNVLQPSTKIVTNQDGVLSELWLTNFPNGLPAGTYTFNGVWTLNHALFQTKSITITFS
jgi:hypothetical protein